MNSTTIDPPHIVWRDAACPRHGDGKADTSTEEADQLVQQLRTLFSGRSPVVISVALADCAACLIAGHHPELRDEVLELHIGLIRKLLPIAVAHVPADAFEEEEEHDRA